MVTTGGLRCRNQGRTIVKTFIITAFASGATGFVAGAGAMLVAFPFLFPPPPADDPLPGTASFMHVSAQAGPANRLAQGTFATDSPGRDALHWANGQVGIYRTGERTVLRLENDFVAGPGPNFIVYLNTKPVGDEKDFLSDPGRRQVAGLRAFRGAQNYILPQGLDLSQFRSVTIWCERFSEFIASADLPKGLGATPGV
jgi:hypothetical protein